MKKLSERVSNLEVLSILEVAAGASPECIDLTVGEPDLPPDPLVKEGIIEALEKNLTKYTADEGILELRKAVADDLKERYGVSYDTDEIIITQGGAGAIFSSLLALLNEGDKAILQSPWYSGHLRALNLLRVKSFPLKTFEKGYPLEINLESLPQDAKIIFLCSPNNPTGMILKHEDLEKILFFAIQNDQIILIDIAYEALTDSGKVPLPIEFKKGKERTIIIGSFSKCYSITGLRIGYVAAPKDIAVGVKKTISTFSFCANSITQYGVLKAFRCGNPNFPSLREEFKRRREICTEILHKAGIKFAKPEGGFFLFPYFEDGRKDVERAKFLVEKAKVITVPGYPFFGPDGKGHLRIALTKPIETLRKALEQIVSALPK
ncbi:MAG: pyridoxal phosphate-dependent aminotransferase [Synergistetes bacterium]|nr:pyridoxal phosphate-dependent aminotransferase [Synergistota bacterium]MCX8127813.1 pyridoxal phosphate-dependent aminotransferase [Synergistota bacterium]MDW8192075.1 pyridoxal phosphate-dependent aminotransferase [Synergistota bacterium]